MNNPFKFFTHPATARVETKQLADAEFYLATALYDLENIQAQIAACRATIARLKPSLAAGKPILPNAEREYPFMFGSGDKFNPYIMVHTKEEEDIVKAKLASSYWEQEDPIFQTTEAKL